MWMSVNTYMHSYLATSLYLHLCTYLIITYSYVTTVKLIIFICIKLSQSGRSPLHDAVATWMGNKEIVEALTKAGADVNIVDKVSFYQTLWLRI